VQEKTISKKKHVSGATHETYGMEKAHRFYQKEVFHSFFHPMDLLCIFYVAGLMLDLERMNRRSPTLRPSSPIAIMMDFLNAILVCSGIV
jgi:hypothetical protein